MGREYVNYKKIVQYVWIFEGALLIEKTIEAHIKVSNMDADCDFGCLPNLIGEDNLLDDVVSNFNTMQGVVTSLVDEKGMTAFVEKSVQRIREKLMELVI